MSSHGNGGYEKTDAAAKPLIVFTLVLTVFTLACFAAGFAFYRLLEKGQSMIDPDVHPMSVKNKINEGAPRLQIREAVDLAAHRAAESEKVDGYGWISREAKIVRVPVDKAIDLVLKGKELKSRE